jgi:hypothetical protein
MLGMGSITYLMGNMTYFMAMSRVKCRQLGMLLHAQLRDLCEKENKYKHLNLK